MYVTQLQDWPEFLAGDHTLLRELLHPQKTPMEISYSLAQGRLPPGHCSKPHRLASSEVYYFLAGKGIFTVGEERREITGGSVVYVAPHETQWVENIGPGDLEFLCLVDPPWKPEDEVVEE